MEPIDVLTPEALIKRFIVLSEDSEIEVQRAAAELANMIMKVSKIRLEEVFYLLQEKVTDSGSQKAIKDIKRLYTNCGALYQEEVWVNP